MSSPHGSLDGQMITLEDLKGRFDVYEQSVHAGYLFVQAKFSSVLGPLLLCFRVWLNRWKA